MGWAQAQQQVGGVVDEAERRFQTAKAEWVRDKDAEIERIQQEAQNLLLADRQNAENIHAQKMLEAEQEVNRLKAAGQTMVTDYERKLAEGKDAYEKVVSQRDRALEELTGKMIRFESARQKSGRI